MTMRQAMLRNHLDYYERMCNYHFRWWKEFGMETNLHRYHYWMRCRKICLNKLLMVQLQEHSRD